MPKEAKTKKSLEEEVAAIEAEESTLAEPPVDQPPVELDQARPRRSKKKKLIFGLIALGVIVAIICAVPFLRYGVAGIVIKKKVELTVVDAKSNRPVSGVKVAFGRFDAQSDAKGVVRINDVAVGDYAVKFEKAHYRTKDATIRVPIMTAVKDATQTLEATGRVLEFSVTNRFSEQPVSGATLTVSEATAATDDKGSASVVVDPNIESTEVVIKAEGYLDANVPVQVINGEAVKQTVGLVPSGKVAFLTKRTGKLDVMTSNLDGGGQEVLLEGTGKEWDHSTKLVHSPDWKYAALMSDRDGKSKVYLLSLADKKLTLIDDAYSQYTIIGWVKNRLYYWATRDQASPWTDKLQAIAAYNTESGAKSVIDETVGSGTDYGNYVRQFISSARIVEDRVVYAKTWEYGQFVADRSRPSYIITITDTAKRVVREVPSQDSGYADVVTNKPQQALVLISGYNGKSEYFAYKNGTVTPVQLSQPQFIGSNHAMIASPNGQRVMWTESRDGKQTTFMSDAPFEKQTERAIGDYSAYGWFGNEYILYSKNNSELFIAAGDKPFDGTHKITDYQGSPIGPGAL